MSFGADDSLQTTGSIFSASFFSPKSLLRRLRSFDSSDELNQTMAGSYHPSALDAENPIPGAMEMEAAGSPTAADPEQESKRARKLVPSVSLAVAALCCGIYASIPAPVQQHPHSHSHPYYNILLAFLALGVFTSLGLFMYSLARPGGAVVVWMRKKVAAIAIVFFLIVSVLRISLYLPVASVGHVWLLFFLVTAVIALHRYTAWKKESRNHAARAPDDQLPRFEHTAGWG